MCVSSPEQRRPQHDAPASSLSSFRNGRTTRILRILLTRLAMGRIFRGVGEISPATLGESPQSRNVLPMIGRQATCLRRGDSSHNGSVSFDAATARTTDHARLCGGSDRRSSGSCRRRDPEATPPWTMNHTPQWKNFAAARETFAMCGASDAITASLPTFFGHPVRQRKCISTDR
jgi:hypothetical protein